MEGGGCGGGGFGCVISQNNHTMYWHSAPPLTAIDRFLMGHTNTSSSSSSHYQTNHYEKSCVQSKDSLISTCGFHGFLSNSSSPSSGGGGGVATGGFPWPSLPVGFPNSLFLDRESFMSPNMGMSEEEIRSSSTNKSSKKKAKGGSNSSYLIKGQWTDEEDRAWII